MSDQTEDPEREDRLDLIQTYAEEGRSLVIFTPPMATDGTDFLCSYADKMQIGG